MLSRWFGCSTPQHRPRLLRRPRYGLPSEEADLGGVTPIPARRRGFGPRLPDRPP
nr:MAG TPA: hypothetical protein [Caudoviricetes sp.]